MPRKAGGSLNIKAFVKDIIESNGIATVKNIEQILKRIDKLEAKISSIKIAPGKKAGKKGQRITTTGPVLDVITKSKKGADLEMIRKKTELEKIQVRNAIMLLNKAGKIKRKSRGVYEAVKEDAVKNESVKQTAKPKVQKKKQAVKKRKPVKKKVAGDKGKIKDSTPSGTVSI